VLAAEVGKRSSTRILQLLRRVREQLQGRVPRLVTTDQFQGYATLLKRVWSQPAGRPRRDKRCTHRVRWCQQPTRPDPAMTYGTVCKQRKNGRVVSVKTAIVFGHKRSLAAALKQSTVSHTINTAFIERQNGTDRHRNARKTRRTYRFSKDWQVHEAVTHFTLYTYNFCWCVRTLAERIQTADDQRTYRQRTPAMAAGLTDRVWPLEEWLRYPIAGLSN